MISTKKIKFGMDDQILHVLITSTKQSNSGWFAIGFLLCFISEIHLQFNHLYFVF